MRNKIKKYWKEKKPVIIIASLIIVILLIVFWVKIGLYINFLLGNDTLIKLKTDKEVLYLNRGEEEKINFKTSSITNPFCKAICNFTFNDISSGEVIDNGEFILKSTNPLEKDYVIKITELGEGQKLYQFNIKCNSKSSILCHTSEESTTRSNIVLVNYNLSEEDRKTKEEVKGELENLKQEVNILLNKEESIKETIRNLNNVAVNDLEEKFNSAKIRVNKDEEILFLLKNFWEEQEYYLLKEEIKKLEDDVNKDEDNLNELYDDLDNLTYLYNSLVIKLNDIDYMLNSLDETNETSNLEILFNSTLSFFKDKNNIEEKEEKVDEIYNKAREIYLLINNEEYDIENNLSIGFINITEKNVELNISFEEPLLRCCVAGKCGSCCVDECKQDKNLFPIIFLHGHAVDKDTSAEYTLEGFGKIEEKLEFDGYLNAGTITLNDLNKEEEGILGLTKIPLTFRGSYYYDVLKEEGNYQVVQANSESIDTYSIRLNELIKILKYRTGKPKVNIIAFSMGGLVTRRYLQIFGSNDVNKIILIGTPNKGIVGEVKGLCPIVGEKLECRDMNEDSLFMNRLNREPDKILIYNIIGSGCKMGQEMGDGIVLEKNALLEGARNYIIQGNCKSKVNPLHIELRNIDSYPVVYDIIINSLRED